MSLVPYILSVAISFFVGLFALQRKKTPGALSFSIMAFLQASWTVGYIFELISPDLQSKIFWDDFQMIGALLYPVAFLIFSLQYTRPVLKNLHPAYLLVSIPALAGLLLTFTDRWHHLIRPGPQLIPGIPYGELTYPFTDTAKIIYFYLFWLYVLGLTRLLQRYFTVQPLYRRQIGLVIGGSFIPIIGIALTILDLSPAFHRDITPLTFAISNSLMAAGFSRFRFLDLVPVAHEAVFSNLSNAVIVLNNDNRIVEINPAAIKIFKLEKRPVIGKYAGQIFSNYPTLISLFADEAAISQEISIHEGDNLKYFQVYISPLPDQPGFKTGRTFALHETTEKVEAEKMLAEYRLQLEEMVSARTRELQEANQRLQREVHERETAEVQLQEYANRLEVLREIDEGILSSRSVSEISARVMTQLQRLIPITWGGVLLYDSEKGYWEALRVIPDEPDQKNFLPLISFTENDILFLRQSKAMLIPDLARHPIQHPALEWLKEQSVNCLFLAPMISQESFLGTVLIGSNQADAIHADDIDIVLDITRLMAISIQHELLFAKEQLRRKELERLERISRFLRLAKRTESMYEMLLAEIQAIGQAEACAVLLPTPGGFQIPYYLGPEVLRAEISTLLTGEETYLRILSGESHEPVTRIEAQSSSAVLILIQFQTSRNLPGAVGAYWSSHFNPRVEDIHLFGMIADMTSIALERVHILETLERQVSDRTRRLQALYELTALLASEKEPAELLPRLLEKIIPMINAEAVILHVQSEDAKSLQWVASSGNIEVAQEIIETLELHDIRWLTRTGHSGRSYWYIGPTSDKPAWIRHTIKDPKQSIVVLPTRVGDRWTGLMTCASQTDQELTIDDISSLSLIADQIGQAIERTRLRERANQALLIEERQRLARELHDSVTQILYSLTFSAKAATNYTHLGRLDLAENNLDLVQEASSQALKEMRLLVYELQPLEVMEEEGLADLLEKRLNAVESRAGMTVDLDVCESLKKSFPGQIEIFRIAQEALNNVIKHAKANGVKVSLFRNQGVIHLTIEDNGNGFDPTQGSVGMGLRSMRERAEKIGANLAIRSKIGQGTTIQLAWKEDQRERKN